jgi:predicted phosphodiesterase
MIKKFVGLFDLHYPDNISLDSTEAFLKDFKPDILVYGGDTWDCEPISHWGEQQRFKEKGLSIIRQELKDQSEGLRALIKRQIKIARAKDIYYLVGNHEIWVKLYQNTYGNAGEPMTLEGFLKPKELGMKIIPQGKTLKIGKLYFMHGDNLGSGIYNSKKAVSEYQKPILYGHFHTVQSYSNVSPIEVEDPQIGQAVACLCHKNPDYGKSKPNRWINGFVYGYIDTRTGQFSYYNVIIVHGKFFYNGKLYK